jgi:hypothetical protein
MTLNFRVRIYNCSYEPLNKEKNGASNKTTYLILNINFDNFKQLRTEGVVGPIYKWGTMVEFEYYTKYSDKLHLKKMTLDVLEQNSLHPNVCVSVFLC